SPIYDEINDILITPYQVKLGNKWGFISEKGKEVTSIKYDEVKAFFQGLAAVKKDDKWGFINLKGEEVVQPKYDEAGSLSENRAKVKLNGKWGYIDATGEEVIIPKYDEVGNFNGGLAGVCINGRWGLIGKNGEVKGKIEFDSIFNGEGMALIRVNRDGGTGYINKAGNIVIPTKYDEVINYNDEAVVVRLKKKWGVYDSTGKIAVPIKYDLIDNVNVYHDDKKGVTTLYVNVTLKKKALFIRFEAKSKKSANGEYTYKKWKEIK
ncbi:MAG: WG repeat-containing protein, partial [Catonella sp.]